MYMMKRVGALLVVGLLAVLILFVYSEKREPSDFNKMIIEYAEGAAEPNTFKKGDIYIDRIFYGSYSQSEKPEMLALCKFRDNPHVAGLERTLAIVISCETFEMVSYKLFAADEVLIYPLPTQAGVSRILFLGSTTYQGVSVQYADSFCIQDHQWEEVPLKELSLKEYEQCSFLEHDMLIVTPQTDVMPGPTGGSADEKDRLYQWNLESGQFELVI